MAKQTSRKSKAGTRRGAKAGMRRGARRGTKKVGGKNTRAKARTKTTRTSTAARRPSPPATSAIEAIAKRIVEVSTANDDEAIFGLYADGVESTEMGQPPVIGIDGIKRKLEMWRGMTTSASFRPRSVATGGNTVMIEWEGTVTLAASGNTVKMDEVAVHEIAGGKIVRERYYYDPAALRP